MKQLLTLIFCAICAISYGQFTPTGTKTNFKNGIALGSKDSTAFNTNDSLAVTIDRNGRFMYRGLGAGAYWILPQVGTDTVPDTRFVRLQQPTQFRQDGGFWISDTGRTSRLFRAAKFYGDTLQATTSAGGKILSNGGTTVAEFGVGGGGNIDFHDFAGYNANRSASYTARSFTDKGYVDSADALRYFGYVVVHSRSTGAITTYKPSANTDAARGVALEAAITAADTSDYIDISPGDYFVTTQLLPKRGQFIDLHGARIYHTDNTIDIFRLEEKSNVTIQNGTLQGAGHSYGMGGSQTDEAGVRSVLNLTGVVKNNTYRNLKIFGFKGPGIYTESEVQTGDSSRYINDIIEGIFSYDNTYGIVNKSGYRKIIGSDFAACDTGFYSGGANVLAIGNNITYNRVGIYQNSGDHGIFSGNNINHNTFRGVHVKDVSFGVTFANNHLYGAYTANDDTSIVIESSKGVVFTGGQFGQGTDNTIKISLRGSTPGYNFIEKVTFVGTNPTIYGTTTQKQYLIIDDGRRTDSAVSVTNTTKQFGIRNITTQGDLTVGNISATSLTTSGSITATGTLAAASAGFGGSVSVGSLASAGAGVISTTLGVGTNAPDAIGYATPGLVGIQNNTDIAVLQMGIVGTGGNTADNLADINAYSKNGTGSVVARQLIRARLDGATNSTAWDIWTMSAGSLSKKWTIDKDGALVKTGGTSSQSLMADGSVQTLTTGSYTPTASNLTNCSSLTPYGFRYTRIGNEVSVYGVISYTITSAATTSFELTLPISSNLTDLWDAAGAGGDGRNPGYQILGESTNNTAIIGVTASSTGSHVISIKFSYTIK